MIVCVTLRGFPYHGQRPLAHTPVWQNMPSQQGCPDSPQGLQTELREELPLQANPGPHQLPPQHGKSLLPQASHSLARLTA